MRSSTFIAFTLGVAMLTPISVSAEETTAASVEGGANMRIKVTAPRDVATGQSSGKRTKIATGTPPRPEVKNRMMGSSTPEKMNERMDAAKERMSERRDEVKTRMLEKKSEILKRMAKQSIVRLRAAVERLSKLANRLEARIAKIKEKGVDTTKATSLLAIARTQITGATTAINEAEASIPAAATQADRSASDTTNLAPGKAVREALHKAEVALKAAHKALVDAIVALKASAPKDALDANASVVVAASTTPAQ